jgi:ferredoxin-thioredoxin reductase catalytic subunit
MDTPITVTEQEIDELYNRLNKEAGAAGYNLNPDTAMTRELCQGYLVNQKRFGYPSCPCRLATGKKEDDLDIVCPCDYRDSDLEKYGGCYCSLYVSKAIKEGKSQITSIPESRPPRAQRLQQKQAKPAGSVSSLPLPVWRCKVCGYLCAREEPPGVCPICKAGKERFERFI